MRFTGEATEARMSSAIPTDSCQRPSRSRLDVRMPRRHVRYTRRSRSSQWATPSWKYESALA
jgi:hypothetical protein